jgi:hypothetical protein
MQPRGPMDLQWTQKNIQGMIIKGQTFSLDLNLIIEGANVNFWSHARKNDTRYSYLEMHTSKWSYRGLELSGCPLEHADLGINIWLKNHIHRAYFRTLTNSTAHVLRSCRPINKFFKDSIINYILLELTFKDLSHSPVFNQVDFPTMKDQDSLFIKSDFSWIFKGLHQ